MTTNEPMNDPTDGGRLCGSRRSPKQIGADGDDGHPFCRLPAGWGTEDPGTGRCRKHGGNTPHGRQFALKQAARIRESALNWLEALLADDQTPANVKATLIRDALDRFGVPRRMEVGDLSEEAQRIRAELDAWLDDHDTDGDGE